jgi:DNA-binding FadR family transcriptional regulator
MPVSAGEHRGIVKAIASGDPATAGRAMFEHAMESKDRTVANHLKRQAAAPASPASPATV